MVPALHSLILRASRRFAVLCVLTAGLAATVLAAPALASSMAPSLVPVSPGPHGYFEYTLAPGASATVGALANRVDSGSRYLIYVAAATTSPVGGVAYGQPTARPTGPAAWLTPRMHRASLREHRRTRLLFHLTVPVATKPGDYVAAIAAQAEAPAPRAIVRVGRRAVGFRVSTRTIVAIVIHVRGRAEAAARFGRPRIWLQQRVRQVLAIPIHDTGGVLIRPYLTARLRTCATGRRVAGLNRQLDTFVPRTSIAYPFYLNGRVLAPGCYQVALALYRHRRGPGLASYTTALHIPAAATHVRQNLRETTPTVATGPPRWLVEAAAGAGLVMLLSGGLLLRGHRQRRHLLARLARAEARATDAP